MFLAQGNCHSPMAGDGSEVYGGQKPFSGGGFETATLFWRITKIE